MNLQEQLARQKKQLKTVNTAVTTVEGKKVFIYLLKFHFEADFSFPETAIFLNCRKLAF